MVIVNHPGEEPAMVITGGSAEIVAWGADAFRCPSAEAARCLQAEIDNIERQGDEDQQARDVYAAATALGCHRVGS